MMSAYPVPVVELHQASVVPDPVTPDEAAALARRIRVEAKLARVALIGTVLGLVCGIAAIWPFLDSDGYMANALVGSNDLGPLTFLPGWLLAGLLPLLAFYAGRLHFESGRSSTGQIETSLRKIRLVILGSMFASAAAFVFVLMQQREHQHGNSDTISWLSLLYVACFSACGVIIGDVRRGLGDFDTEYQRRRRRLVRGFMVELRPTETAAPQDVIPMAALAEPATSKTPRSQPVATALPASEAGEDEHFTDLRLIMTVAIATAIPVHGVRVGEAMGLPWNSIDSIFSNSFSLFGGASPTGLNPLTAIAALLALVAALLLLPCGVLWLVWGIVSLSYGPAFRRTLGWLTALTLALAVLYVLPAWMDGGDVDYVFRRSSFKVGGRLSRAPEIVHCLFIGLLLTRPGINRLFSRSNQMDDQPDH